MISLLSTPLSKSSWCFCHKNNVNTVLYFTYFSISDDYFQSVCFITFSSFYYAFLSLSIHLFYSFCSILFYSIHLQNQLYAFHLLRLAQHKSWSNVEILCTHYRVMIDFCKHLISFFEKSDRFRCHFSDNVIRMTWWAQWT